MKPTTRPLTEIEAQILILSERYPDDAYILKKAFTMIIPPGFCVSLGECFDLLLNPEDFEQFLDNNELSNLGRERRRDQFYTKLPYGITVKISEFLYAVKNTCHEYELDLIDSRNGELVASKDVIYKPTTGIGDLAIGKVQIIDLPDEVDRVIKAYKSLEDHVKPKK
ncbi:MAG: hypothetical protein ABII01_06605 [Candidatus Woesearchaeota archaeon]